MDLVDVFSPDVHQVGIPQAGGAGRSVRVGLDDPLAVLDLAMQHEPVPTHVECVIGHELTLRPNGRSTHICEFGRPGTRQRPRDGRRSSIEALTAGSVPSYARGVQWEYTEVTGATISIDAWYFS